MYREKFDKVEFQKTVKSNVKRLYRKTVEEATQQQLPVCNCNHHIYFAHKILVSYNSIISVSPNASNGNTKTGSLVSSATCFERSL